MTEPAYQGGGLLPGELLFPLNGTYLRAETVVDVSPIVKADRQDGAGSVRLSGPQAQFR
jgi:hypothetical protein